MIDARTHHNPGRAPDLIQSALEVAGSQKELAARLGVTPRHVIRLKQGQSPMDYTTQVTLEAITGDARSQTSPGASVCEG